MRLRVCLCVDEQHTLDFNEGSPRAWQQFISKAEELLGIAEVDGVYRAVDEEVVLRVASLEEDELYILRPPEGLAVLRALASERTPSREQEESHCWPAAIAARLARADLECSVHEMEASLFASSAEQRASAQSETDEHAAASEEKLTLYKGLEAVRVAASVPAVLQATLDHGRPYFAGARRIHGLVPVHRAALRALSSKLLANESDRSEMVRCAGLGLLLHILDAFAATDARICEFGCWVITALATGRPVYQQACAAAAVPAALLNLLKRRLDTEVPADLLFDRAVLAALLAVVANCTDAAVALGPLRADLAVRALAERWPSDSRVAEDSCRALLELRKAQKKKTSAEGGQESDDDEVLGAHAARVRSDNLCAAVAAAEALRVRNRHQDADASEAAAELLADLRLGRGEKDPRVHAAVRLGAAIGAA